MLSGHGIGDSGIGPALLERADEVVARQHADRAARAIDYRELALAGVQQRLHRSIDMLVGRQRGELVIIAASLARLAIWRGSPPDAPPQAAAR